MGTPASVDEFEGDRMGGHAHADEGAAGGDDVGDGGGSGQEES